MMPYWRFRKSTESSNLTGSTIRSASFRPFKIMAEKCAPVRELLERISGLDARRQVMVGAIDEDVTRMRSSA
jgi:hypothetical protein